MICCFRSLVANTQPKKTSRCICFSPSPLFILYSRCICVKLTISCQLIHMNMFVYLFEISICCCCCCWLASAKNSGSNNDNCYTLFSNLQTNQKLKMIGVCGRCLSRSTYWLCHCLLSLLLCVCVYLSSHWRLGLLLPYCQGISRRFTNVQQNDGKW